MTVADLRKAYAVAQTITKPGIYFTGQVFLCNQTRGTTTIDQNPYAYDYSISPFTVNRRKH